MRIAVVGSGYVGLVTGTCFADLGHEVVLVDNDEEKVAALRNGEVPIHENFLPEPMRQRDAQNTGRADFTVPANRLNATFFNAIRWQKRAPGSPNDGGLNTSTMLFYDGVGPNGASLVVGGYHWPKGVQGMDRQTGKFFWAGNPDGGESIGANSAAFSPDGLTVYISNDNTPHPQMAFSAAFGPDVYWHNGADANATLLGAWSPKVAPDGRIFSHGWCSEIGALTDDGLALRQTWFADPSLDNCRNNPALLVDGPGGLVGSS